MGLELASRAAWLAEHVLVHERALRAWLGRSVVAGLEVDDIVQESYAILARLERTDHIHNPAAYLFKTARSVILGHVRRSKVVPIDAVEEIERLSLPLADASPEQQVADRQELRRLTQVVEQLPAKCRRAFILRKVEGLSHREIAQRMDISESTVEKHVARALCSVMRIYREDEGSALSADKRARNGTPSYGAARDSAGN